MLRLARSSSALASARRFASGASGIWRVGVLGAGQMGTGIAVVAAREAGLDVIISDVSQEAVDRSRAFVDKLLAKDVKKGKITEEVKDKTIANLSFTTDGPAAFTSSDLVVEAVSENLQVKEKLFRDLDAHAPDHAILASNTSSISITKLAACTGRPEKVIGMHFMNPVPVMKLVEIIPGLATSSETTATTVALAEKMGKTTAVANDMPGFIANRILMPYINEAVMALQDSVGTVDAIDTTMKLGTNVPMGPLQLADFIGLDTCLAIMRVLHSELGDSKYRPSPLLIKYVDAGWLGKKSGRGFYQYES